MSMYQTSTIIREACIELRAGFGGTIGLGAGNGFGTVWNGEAALWQGILHGRETRFERLRTMVLGIETLPRERVCALREDT